MTSTEITDPLSSDALQEARAEVMPALEAAEQRILRLIATAHEDEKRAQNELLRLLRNGGGVEHIIKILASETKRHWHFGALKGAFLVRGKKANSRAALAELPDALRERKLLGDRLADLTKAHRQALEREEREFFEERARALQQGREPPTREQYQERRRKRH